MQPLPTSISETIVSSVHGNNTFSDATCPISICHHSQGAVLTPPAHEPREAAKAAGATEVVGVAEVAGAAGAAGWSGKPTVVVGKVHYTLPTLRALREEELQTRAIASTALEIAVSPHGGRNHHENNPGRVMELPLHGQSKITRVELYAGRQLLGSWGNEPGDQSQEDTLPADRDFQIHVTSAICGEGDSPFNENHAGLEVTLTVELRGEMPGLMVSSVALVQTIRLGGFGY